MRPLAVEVIAVFGPTASGKSAVAEALADRLRSEVVAADALQVYRELPILTNQPTRPTRLVGIRSTAETMSVGEYATMAHAEIDELVAAHGTVVVAGGTGLYLRAALADMQVPPAVSGDARRRWEQTYDADAAAAFTELERRDPKAAATLHPNDRHRVIRALELSEIGASLAPKGDRLWAGALRRPTLVVGLVVPPAELERRIRDRARQMFEDGVVDEVRCALTVGVSRTAEKALGLQEIASLPPAEALERIVLRTRQYASYQRKWMRRIPGLVRIEGLRDPEAIADEIVALDASHAGD